jgi:acyl-CoA thioesterase
MARPDGGALPAIAMFDRDAASRALGMRLVDAGEGWAVIEMTVRPDMVNGLDTCHGGVIFTLADSAMAVASNSSNERSFAIHADIDWLNPGQVGSVLTATAHQTTRRGRTAVNDVTVIDDGGTVVAMFRGRTRSVGNHSPTGA